MNKKKAMLPLFSIVLLDMLGIGIIIPIIAPIMLDPASGALSASYSLETRNILLGLIIAVFPFFQFFGAPILGALSDKYGRKKLLIVSMIGGAIGYFLFGLGVEFNSIYLLFAGRIIAGFMGGNISIAFSAIADISSEKEKAKNFGMIGMAFGLGFIIGPYIGGKLADPSFVPWFDFATPLWFAAILSLINVLMVVLMLPETLHTKIDSKISIFTGFRNIGKALKMKNLRTVFLVIFLHTLGFSFFAQFFQVLLMGKFSYTQVQVGNLFAYVGIWIAFAQGVATRIISKYLRPAQALRISLILLSFALFAIIIPTKSHSMYFIMPFIALFQGISFPNSTALVSNLSGKESQGEALGINQSLQSLSMSIGPLIAGIIVSYGINLPMIAASAIVLIAWLVFLLFFKEERKEVFHEV